MIKVTCRCDTRVETAFFDRIIWAGLLNLDENTRKEVKELLDGGTLEDKIHVNYKIKENKKLKFKEWLNKAVSKVSKSL